VLRSRSNKKQVSLRERLQGWFRRAPRPAAEANRAAIRRPPVWPAVGRGLGRFAGLLLGWLVPLVALAAAFLTPVIGVQAYHYVMQAGHFQVREVRVDGNRTLGYEAIRRICGLDQATHVLAADLEAMADRLEAHPWIAWAEVERQLPGRLIIRIGEEEAAAYLVMGKLYLVNPQGEVFAQADPAEDRDLPLITGIPAGALGDPAHAPRMRQAIRVALHLARLHAELGLQVRWPIAELRVQPEGQLTLVLSGSGTEAVLGEGRYREKLYRLEWVLEHLRVRGKQADYILLDDRGEPGDEGRVRVRADLAPTEREQRERAREFAEKAKAEAEVAPAATEPGAEDGTRH
jgi:cell division protein FtsQ